MIGMHVFGRDTWRHLMLLTLIAILSINISVAQEETESPCPEVTDKKALKAYTAGIDRKKNDKMKRMESLREAIEIEPEYAQAYFALGVEQIRTAKAGNQNFKPAEKSLKKAIEICPEVHYDAYYWLGEIALGRNEYSNAVGFYDTYYKMTRETDDRLSDRREDAIKENYDFANFFHQAYTNPVDFDPKLVRNVSGKGDEYLPLISPDNEFMLYTRKTADTQASRSSVNSRSQQFTEQFIRSAQDGGVFDGGETFPSPFNENKTFNYGGASVSIDNKHIFVTICKPLTSTKYNNCDIYSSDYVFGFNERTQREEFYWTDLKDLGPNVNGKRTWESQPSLSSDGQTLFFATSRENTKGIDIFSSELKNGVWQKAVSLGPVINTDGNEKTPFMHSDSRTLYFASDYHLGFGGYDVFMAKMDKSGQWSEPSNIGYPINSEKDEHGFIVSTDGKSVYFASDNLQDKGGVGGLDIYRFRLHKDARPEDVVFLKGEITDKEGDPIKNGRIEIKNMKTREVQQIKVDETDGKYAAVITVEEEEDFVVNVKADGMAFNSHFIPSKKTMEEIKESTEDHEERERVNDLDPNKAHDGDMEDVVEDVYLKIDAKLEEVEVGGIYRINSIYYSTSSADLTHGSKAVLDEFAQYLIENPTMVIDIHGHTDDVGDANVNLVLSTDRAFSVMAYLQEHGVPANRLSFKGFGESNPFTSNSTPEGRAQNRRTEFKIISK